MTKDANPALSTSADSTVYLQLAFVIIPNNARTSDQISIVLNGRNGSRTSWSVGQAFSPSSGIVLRGIQGVVPISSLEVGNDVIKLDLSSSDTGDSTPIRLIVYLTAPKGVREFTLEMTSHAGGSASVALPRGQSRQLSGSPSTFGWPS